MTCVVGIEVDGGVLLGADSIASNGVDACIRCDRKLIRLGPYAFGFTTSWRMGDILRYHVVLPSPPRSGLHRHLVTKVIPAVREAFKVHGWAAKEPEAPGGEFLVGVHGSLFTVHADFQVARSAHGYAAVGYGASPALGALCATSEYEPRVRARAALEAAERHTVYVRRPWRFLLLGDG